MADLVNIALDNPGSIVAGVAVILTGAVTRSWFGLLGWPLLLLGFGLLSKLTEGQTDMPNFGLIIFGAAAVISLALAVLGRAIGWAVGHIKLPTA